MLGVSSPGQDPRSQEVLSLLIATAELSRESIVITDAELNRPGPRIVYINPAFTRMTGYTAAEVLGQTPRLLQGAKTNPAMLAELRRALEQGTIFTTEGVNYRKDGSEYIVDWQITPLRDAAGVIRHYVAFQRDITVRKRRERDLAESEERFRTLVERSPDAMFVHAHGKIVFANEALTRLLRAESVAQFVGRDVLELFPEQYRANFAAILSGSVERPQHFVQHQFTRFDRTLVDVESVGIPITFDGAPATQVLLHDLTERIQLEQQVLQAQRLESIGMLAAGIAHDLNNVLAPILMAAPMLHETAATEAEKGMLKAIETSATRGAALVKQILSFARGAVGEPQLVDLRHLVGEVANVLRRTLPQAIQIQVVNGRQTTTVHANPSQAHQVILNLCVNARDAMPSGGTLRVGVSSVRLDTLAAEKIPGARTGTWARLEVSDTGLGIPDEVLAHMWDPFFTTKGASAGTGLGLSTVRGIVDTHAGFVEVRTKMGQGTTIHVYFPAADGVAAAATAEASGVEHGNGELVLVVDDDQRIRDLAAEVLARHGYRVILASDGPEASRLFLEHRSEVVLLVTDLDMPKQSGATLALVIRQLKPEVRTLLMSGTVPLASAPADLRMIGDAFLSKPFTVEELLHGVHQLLAPRQT